MTTLIRSHPGAKDNPLLQPLYLKCFPSSSFHVHEALTKEHHSQGPLLQVCLSKYCILALQSLNVEKSNLRRIKTYYYPPLCNSNKNTKKVQTAIYTAIYIRSDLVYTIPISSPFPDTLEEIYATTAMVKINEQTTLNIISVYFPNGPKGDNTDWLKDIALSNKSYVIMGDFNAHAPFWENGCTSVTCNRHVENIVDSSLCLLNDGRITRIPDVSTHKATAFSCYT